MENLSEDEKVVDLLTKLRDSNGGYPSDMLAARRRTYLKQMANVGLGIGVGAGLKEAAKGSGNGASAATTASSKLLEMALVAAIAVEAGTAAFLYRDKIANAIRSRISEPTVQEVSPPSNESSVTDPILLEAVGTPLVAASATPTPSATFTSTPSGTLSTSVAGSNNQDGNDNGGANTSINANATPQGNQGNQYGLTPKPERTKESNSGGSTDDGGTDDGGGNNDGSSKNKKP